MKSRKAGSGTGSAWAQYTDELATASTTADTKAGEPQYVTTTFTVPADAAPEGALWLSFSDMGLADDCVLSSCYRPVWREFSFRKSGRF
ncbi:hypothetical protein [Bifidobacterium bifidum]|uniref:hypothetical protein n=1 Tax=Bifidobacterium bifidum TaxID=1681 RepID=UPI00232BB011|nr:hypothetical protein [Bifidobacterium bifidum]